VPDTPTTTPILSTKGLLALGVVFTYVGMWAFALYTIMKGDMEFAEVTEFLLQFAGATGVMGMIVLLIIQNYFRKTEAQ